MSIFTTVTILTLLSFVLSLNTSPLAARDNTTNWQQRNYDTIAAIYNETIYPNNQAFIETGISAIPPKLFSPNAAGRITPIGNFSGFEDSVEYFFGLTPPVQAPLYDTWTKATITHFTSGCPEVASSVVLGETTGVNPNFTDTYGKKITTIKQVAFWRFDTDGSVLYYDAWLPNLRLYTTRLYGTAPNPQVNAAVIDQICGQATKLCTGANTQYSDKDDCVKQLSAKDFGDWDEVWGDNVVCRSLHVLLAGLRPDVSIYLTNIYT